MTKSKNAIILTTGQVAKICQVAPRTVTKWFDSGQLKGYRIPGSLDRRIPRASLVTFLSDNGMPLGELQRDTAIRVLIIGDQPELVVMLTTANANFELHTVQTTFEAGSAAVTYDPHCVVLDTDLTEHTTPNVIAGLRGIVSKSCPIVGLLAERADDAMQDLFDESFRSPFDINLLSTRVETLAVQARAAR